MIDKHEIILRREGSPDRVVEAPMCRKYIDPVIIGAPTGTAEDFRTWIADEDLRREKEHADFMKLLRADTYERTRERDDAGRVVYAFSHSKGPG